MSKAQKQAQNKFKEAVKIAKQLRAKDPKLSHPEAVKKAFSQLSGPTKPAAKKTVKPVAKKTAQKTARPVAKKKASCSTDHRDSKSHNVNIRVMSGYPYASVSELVTLYKFDELRSLRNEKEDEIKTVKKRIQEIQKDIDLPGTTVFKKGAKKLLTTYKNALRHYTKQLNSYNKALEKY